MLARPSLGWARSHYDIQRCIPAVAVKPGWVCGDSARRWVKMQAEDDRRHAEREADPSRVPNRSGAWSGKPGLVFRTMR
jgi:hypothetical protein